MALAPAVDTGSARWISAQVSVMSAIGTFPPEFAETHQIREFGVLAPHPLATNYPPVYTVLLILVTMEAAHTANLNLLLDEHAAASERLAQAIEAVDDLSNALLDMEEFGPVLPSPVRPLSSHFRVAFSEL